MMALTPVATVAQRQSSVEEVIAKHLAAIGG